MPHVTYFTDCDDEYARLYAALAAHLKATMTVSEIKPEEVQRAGLNLVDVIAAGQTVSRIQNVDMGIVLANIAPRDKSQGVHKNGPPFCYFTVPGRTKLQARTLVVSTYNEELLALAHRLGLVDTVNLLDIPEVVKWGVEKGWLTDEEAETIETTQFRSLEFVPFVTYLLKSKYESISPNPRLEVPYKPVSLGDVQGPAGVTLRIDKFGNVYTDVLPEDVDFQPGGNLRLESGEEVPCYLQLAEVPKGQLAAVIGSSGYGQQRFIMLAVQGLEGDSAAELLKAKVGCPVISATELVDVQSSMAEIGR